MSRPGSLRKAKGAIVGIDVSNPVVNAISFQYNPSQVSRTLEPQMATKEGADFTEALRLEGAPVESFQFDIELDDTEQVSGANSGSEQYGIYPKLSALEMLVYPKSMDVIFRSSLLALGTIEVLPSFAPLTLLIWGIKRILPVRITSFSIIEEMHDINLNPIRATVSLGLRVLSYNDLSIMHPGYHLFLAHQMVKETMAAINTFNGNLNIIPRSLIGRL